jgi:hypothetical protein
MHWSPQSIQTWLKPANLPHALTLWLKGEKPPHQIETFMKELAELALVSDPFAAEASSIGEAAGTEKLDPGDLLIKRHLVQQLFELEALLGDPDTRYEQVDEQLKALENLMPNSADAYVSTVFARGCYQGVAWALHHQQSDSAYSIQKRFSQWLFQQPLALIHPSVRQLFIEGSLNLAQLLAEEERNLLIEVQYRRLLQLMVDSACVDESLAQGFIQCAQLVLNTLPSTLEGLEQAESLYLELQAYALYLLNYPSLPPLLIQCAQRIAQMAAQAGQVDRAQIFFDEVEGAFQNQRQAPEAQRSYLEAAQAFLPLLANEDGPWFQRFEQMQQQLGDLLNHPGEVQRGWLQLVQVLAFSVCADPLHHSEAELPNQGLSRPQQSSALKSLYQELLKLSKLHTGHTLPTTSEQETAERDELLSLEYTALQLLIQLAERLADPESLVWVSQQAAYWSQRFLTHIQQAKQATHPHQAGAVAELWYELSHRYYEHQDYAAIAATFDTLQGLYRQYPKVELVGAALAGTIERLVVSAPVSDAQVQEAFAHFPKLIKTFPSNGDILCFYARCCSEMANRFQQAELLHGAQRCLEGLHYLCETYAEEPLLGLEVVRAQMSVLKGLLASTEAVHERLEQALTLYSELRYWCVQHHQENFIQHAYSEATLMLLRFGVRHFEALPSSAWMQHLYQDLQKGLAPVHSPRTAKAQQQQASSTQEEESAVQQSKGSNSTASNRPSPIQSEALCEASYCMLLRALGLNQQGETLNQLYHLLHLQQSLDSNLPSQLLQQALAHCAMQALKHPTGRLLSRSLDVLQRIEADLPQAERLKALFALVLHVWEPLTGSEEPFLAA